MQKRYQYMGPQGITWTKWFHILNTKDLPKYQLGTDNTKFKLLNEYRKDEEID